MSGDKKSLIDLIPDSVDNAVKNITDKPTQNMGTTLADIWYLVFGGISQAAEKRKLKYSYALQEFEKELQEKISKIPEDKLVVPDIQITAKALEEAKYCIDKEELRHMFSSLISNSLISDCYISPSIINTVSSLSSLNAKMLNYYYSNYTKRILAGNVQNGDKIITETKITMDKLINKLNSSPSDILTSIWELENLNLIQQYAEDKQYPTPIVKYPSLTGTFIALENTQLSQLGVHICQLCIT